MPDDFVKVAAVSEVSPGDMKVVDVGDDQILLVNVDGEVPSRTWGFFATTSAPTHRVRVPVRG